MNKKVFILVADGSRAKFLKRQNRHLAHVEDTHHPDEFPLFKDPGEHKPGVSLHSGPSSESHLYEPHTSRKEVERDYFSRKIAERINTLYDAFDELILVAPAKLLGNLRSHLNPLVHKKIKQEVPKDFTKLSMGEIYEHLEMHEIFL
jgi:protein required for attachment to host cells